MSKQVSDAKCRKALSVVKRHMAAMGYEPEYLDREVIIGTYGDDATPTVYFEGGHYEWALTEWEDLQAKFDKIGVFAQPAYSFALSLYPQEVN